MLRILFRCLISSRCIGTATKTMTTEIGLGILSSTNSLVEVARLHCNIELGQDKAGVLSKLVQFTANLCCMCFLLPLPGPSPTSSLRQTRFQHPSLPPNYFATNIHTAQSLQHPPSKNSFRRRRGYARLHLFLNAVDDSTGAEGNARLVINRVDKILIPHPLVVLP